MGGRKAQAVLISRLVSVFAPRGSAEDPAKVIAYFKDVSGPAALTGRETRLAITLPELADLVGAIPASLIEDPGDFRALLQTMNVLHREGHAKT